MAKKIRKPEPEVPRRPLARDKRQRRIQLIIIAVSAFLVVAVLGVVGTGWYLNQYRPLREVVIRVNDTEFTMDYYLELLKFYAKDQNVFAVFQIADQLVLAIQQNELIRQEAAKLGLAVSDEEADAKLKELELPINASFRDFMRRDLLLQKLQDEYFKPKMPTSAPQRHVLAMLLEGDEQAESVRARIEAGELFAQLASDSSLDDYSKGKQGDLGWHPQDVLVELLSSSAPGDFAFGAQIGELSQPLYDANKTKSVGYWLIKVIEKRSDPSDQIHLQVTLLGSEQEAKQMRARLVAGEDFATLAKELSQHKGSKDDGGIFEWLSVETLKTDTTFAAWTDAVNMEVGQLSEPLRDFSETTTGGYWLVRLLEKEDSRDISDDDRTLLAAKATDEWITALQENPDNKLENLLTGELKEWAVKQAMGGSFSLGG